MSNNEKEATSLIEKNTIAWERRMHAAFFVIFLVLIMVQAAIFIPSTKPAVIDNEALMGEPIGKEEFLYKEGAMVLTLVNFENYPALKVLVNGVEKASFLGKTVNINVLDGDVVELDGSGTNASSTVKVSSTSPNLDEKYKEKTFIVGREVMIIFKVRVS